MKGTFDKKLAELEEIVSKIQDKSTGLEESMDLFEQGVKLTSECLKFLNESKGHIEDLTEKLNSIKFDEDVSNE